MTKTFKAVLIFCAATFFIGCQKDFSLDTGNPAQPAATNITATVAGRVTDQTGLPVSGALVKAGAFTATTNINGEFVIENTNLVDQAAFVRVEKAGYFNGSRTFIARANQKHYVEIELLTRNTVGNINASAGGTINVANGSSITLPAGGVVDEASGAVYTGTVQVSMAWINPTSTSLFRQMPGDLRGIDASGRENNLQSYGMLAVELTGSGGQKLQIASGKKASLKFPLPNSIQSAAPATIPLWSFNETTGLWKQEGSATKSGNVYLAEVSHFSFWNCDAAFLNVNFSATFKDQNGKALAYRLVKITRTGAANGIILTTYGFTDSTGYVGGRVPQNETMVLQVLGTYNCSQAIYSQNIGPFTANSNASLGVITVNTGSNTNYTLTGTVNNCSGLPVSSGYINILTPMGPYSGLINNGTFNVNFPSCGGTHQITYVAVDNSGLQQSTPVSVAINPGATNLGTITACGTSTNEFITFTFKGATYTMTPQDSIYGRAWTFQAPMTNIGGASIVTGLYVNMNTMGQSIGNFNLDNMDLGINGVLYTDAITNGTASFTEYGQINQFISGTVTTMLKDSLNPTPYPFNCTFRVRRLQ